MVISNSSAQKKKKLSQFLQENMNMITVNQSQVFLFEETNKVVAQYAVRQLLEAVRLTGVRV